MMVEIGMVLVTQSGVNARQVKLLISTVLSLTKKMILRPFHQASGLSKIYMQLTGTGCKFNGQDLTQRAGETCDTGSDCAR